MEKHPDDSFRSRGRILKRSLRDYKTMIDPMSCSGRKTVAEKTQIFCETAFLTRCYSRLPAFENGFCPDVADLGIGMAK